MTLAILAALIGSVAFAFALTYPASGVCLYVSAEGRDDTDGRSPGSPLRTLGAAAKRAARW
jgi:hypothetical protein